MTIPTTAPVQYRSLVDIAYDLVRDAILDGHCTPGEALNVDDVMAAAGCSRTPVMTALDRLLQDGLLERRYRLHVISPTQADGRAAAETLGWFARRLTEHTADADVAINAVRALDAAGGRAPFEQARQAFAKLCFLASNQVLADMLQQHIDALLYRAQHANPVVSLAAAA